RRPDEHEELAVCDLDAQVVDGFRFVELLGHVLERDRCHQRSSRTKWAAARNEYATVKVRNGITAAATPATLIASTPRPNASVGQGRAAMNCAALRAVTRSGTAGSAIASVQSTSW